jgi:hypothetical protein
MESPNEPLLIFWRAFGDWGFILVIVGVLGEVLAAAVETVWEKCSLKNLDKWKSRLKRYEIIAGWILIIGLAMEYNGHKYETQILDSDNAKLGLKAEQAGVDAATARLLAAQIETTNAQLTATNLELEKQVVELQLKLQPRMITLEQITNFIYLTEKITKIPIKIETGAENGDNVSYASHIRILLTAAGFKLDSSAGILGVTINPTRIVTRRLGFVDEDWVKFVVYGTNDVEKIYKDLNFETTAKGIIRPVVTENDDKEIFSAISFSLNQIGIKTGFMNGTSWVKPGEFEFFIIPKNL